MVSAERAVVPAGRLIWLSELDGVLCALEEHRDRPAARDAIDRLRRAAELADRKRRSAIRYTPPAEFAQVITTALERQRRIRR